MEKVKFEELSLSTEMQRAITEIGYEEASPIQAEAIPALLAGRDVIGQAQTGTGKTAAFSIPAILAVTVFRPLLPSLVVVESVGEERR